ncbi:MAG: hypothetical protein F7B60_01940 [Desulfurococcales archaeon]|nr:hypothetical protein [Desulfurococcales archaeon]
MKSKSKYGLMAVSLLVILVLVATLRFMPMVNANRTSASLAYPVKGKVVWMTKGIVKVIINGREYTLKMYSGVPMEHSNGEFFLIVAGDVSQNVHNARSVQVYTASKPAGSNLNKITVIEP